MGHIEIVIGANFGDEGKGLVTCALSKQYRFCQRTLNILYNGGCQRGHTAQNHVFHCFGSGTLMGADTYYDKEFLVDPIGWDIERHQLGIKGQVYAHPDCTIVTPYDIAINQAIEAKRGNSRHGSCGMGIFETTLRNKEFPIYLKDCKTATHLYEKLQEVYHKYLPKRLTELSISAIPFVDLNPFISAATKCYDYCFFDTYNRAILKSYSNLIFEGGQGLLLDKDNTKYFPHLTPSHTGSKRPYEILKEIDKLNEEIIVNYVTRPYMTRHGAGPFATECSKEDINPAIVDRTNLPNPHQGTLRFGFMDLSLLTESIKKDFAVWKDCPDANIRLCLTQTNYSDGAKFIIRENRYESVLAFALKLKNEEKLPIYSPRYFNSELI